MSTQVWFNNDSLFGGETFECTRTANALSVKKGDLFRIEKRGNNPIELIPHPANKGGWKHDKTNPVRLKPISEVGNRRLFEFDVQLDQGQKKTLFFLQRDDLSTVFLEKKPGNGRQNGGSASIRR